jgi:hypothetical protein
MIKSHYCGSAFNATAIALALAIILVLSTLISMIIPISENAFAYEKNQATSQASDCGNGQEPENIGCQNIGSSIQGDENAVNIIGQQSFPTRTVKPPPEETATLIVIKKVACVPGEECSPLPAATEFMLSVTDDNGDEIPVEGSSTGTEVPLPPGDYAVFDDPSPPPGPAGTEFVGFTGDEGCSSDPPPTGSGPIEAGEERICIVTNFYSGSIAIP